MAIPATEESIAFETEHLDCLIGSLTCNRFLSDFDKEVIRFVSVDSFGIGTEPLEGLTGSMMEECCASDF